jgi:hypothetical protein
MHDDSINQPIYLSVFYGRLADENYYYFFFSFFLSVFLLSGEKRIAVANRMRCLSKQKVSDNQHAGQHETKQRSALFVPCDLAS